MRKITGHGPAQADLVIVGEAPGEDEELEGRPFVGASGRELTRLLREAGIKREDCYITNVCKYRPPMNRIEAWITDKKGIGTKNEWPLVNGRYVAPPIEEGLAELYDEIAARKPRLVVGLGNAALWAFTGEWGVMNWRGSEMRITLPEAAALHGTRFVPTLHPASILRAWPHRAYLAHDLTSRVARRLRDGFPPDPEWDFNIAPTLSEVYEFLAQVREHGEAAVDVETSRGRIVCVGLAVSARRAMCIPFISEGYGAYWQQEQYHAVLAMLRETLPKIRIIGQNFNYDADYFYDNFNLALYPAHDTKVAQNVLFPGMPANLGFLASMHCDWHSYWKEDARDWQNLRDFDGLFTYNCRDVCSTYEIAVSQRRQIAAARLSEQFEDRMRYCGYVFRMQQRGVCVSEPEKVRLVGEIEETCHAHARAICDAAGRPINLASPKQVSTFLYKDLGLRKPAKGDTDNEALKQLQKWHPDRADLLAAIIEWRALASVRNNFLGAQLDPDNRLRTSFLPTGTETYRLTSGKSNFGRGANLLNISGNGFSHKGNKLPNLRRCIVPPSGYTIFDCDLARADLQVVVWEADDADLKAKMRAGVDIHTENAKDVFGVREPTKMQREMSKKFVHLTDYGGTARTAAIQCGTTVHEADMAQRRWFSAHPGIPEWHKRVRAALQSVRTVRNRFGYRCVFFDRVDDAMFREALAWIPQSTIAIVASRVHMRMEDEVGAEVLIQMYDSVMGIYPTVEEEKVLPKLHEATKIVIPYDDPLIVPMGIKTSTTSWGDCTERKWAAR